MPDEVLQQLNDIHTPPPADWWPLAPGWWILAALLIGAVAVTGVLLWRRQRRLAPRRAALARLARYPSPESPDPAWFAGLNRLLKEAALARHPGEQPAGLSGDQWSRFLARTSGDPHQPWHQLVSASYQPHSDLPPERARQMAEHWIRRQSW